MEDRFSLPPSMTSISVRVGAAAVDFRTVGHPEGTRKGEAKRCFREAVLLVAMFPTTC